MYILDNNTFRAALKNAGYRSINDLAKYLDIHRNTIQYYLSGAPILNSKLDKILDALKLLPSEAFRKIEKKSEAKPMVIKFADKISRALKEPLAVVLFGSRARGDAHRYSDFDIGVYSKKGLSNKDFLKLFKYKDEFEENSPYIIDLINLNEVDTEFIRNIANEFEFLSGNGESWLSLKNINEKR